MKEEFEKQQQLFNEQAATLTEKDATITQYSQTIADYENKEKDIPSKQVQLLLPADILQAIADKKDTLTIKELNTELSLEYTKFSMAKEHKEGISYSSGCSSKVSPEKAALVNILKNTKSDK